jgi:hypothetical protein
MDIVERPPRSLETKWDLIKHYVSKFVGLYNNVVSLNELGSSIENLFRKPLSFINLNNAKV